jgi:hypothetical protein
VPNTDQASQLGQAGKEVRLALLVAIHSQATGCHPEFPAGQLAFDGTLGARVREEQKV